MPLLLTSDIKECDLSPCDHFCHEEEGAYNCSCQSGFKLGPDRVTCEGEYIITGKH